MGDMVARLVLAATVLATSLFFAAPSGAQRCYPPPCGAPSATVDSSDEQRTVHVAGGPAAEPRSRPRELSRTGSAGVLPELSVAAGVVLVGGTLLAITRRRLRSGHRNLDQA